MAEPATIMIPADTGPEAAGHLCLTLLDRIGAKGAPMVVELDAPGATAIALQLAVACRKTLQGQGRFAGYGPNGKRFLQAGSPGLR